MPRLDGVELAGLAMVTVAIGPSIACRMPLAWENAFPQAAPGVALGDLGGSWRRSWPYSATRQQVVVHRLLGALRVAGP